MHKSAMFGVVALAAFVSTGVAFAQGSSDGQFHCPVAGTHLETSLGRHWTAVREIPPIQCEYRSDKGNFTLTSLITVNPDRYNPNNILEQLWPLQVGKRIDYTTSMGNRSSKQTVEVVSKEAITVKAGHFDVYVIKWTTQSSFRGVHIENVYYWSPKVATVVKYTFKASLTNEYLPDWEMVKISGP